MPMQVFESIVCSHNLTLLCFAGGMQKGFCILMLCQLLNISLYGMKILESNTSMEISKFLFISFFLLKSTCYMFIYVFLHATTRYIELVKKHGLEISQPGLEPNNGLTWEMTKRRGDREVHM